MRQPSSISTPASASLALPKLPPRERIAGLRQVEEFSTKLVRLRRVAYLSAGILVVLVAACVYLFVQHIEIIALYTAGAAVLLIQLVLAGSDYYHEERRTVEAYWKYLDTYSYQVI